MARKSQIAKDRVKRVSANSDCDSGQKTLRGKDVKKKSIDGHKKKPEILSTWAGMKSVFFIMG